MMFRRGGMSVAVQLRNMNGRQGHWRKSDGRHLLYKAAPTPYFLLHNLSHPFLYTVKNIKNGERM